MVTVAFVTTPNTPGAPDSVPRRVFREVPDVEIEIESLVPLGERAIPYIWVWGETLDRFERALGGFPEVTDLERLDSVDGGGLYRVEWDIDSPVLQAIARAGGSVMDAYGTAARWELTLWFEGGGDASAFRRHCREQDVPLTVERIGTTAVAPDDSQQPVTPRQREALETAYTDGYFQRPRGTSQAAIGDELGISAAATGDRLRRGTANLIESVLELG